VGQVGQADVVVSDCNTPVIDDRVLRLVELGDFEHEGDGVAVEMIVVMEAVVGFRVQVAPVGHGQTIPDSYSLTQEKPVGHTGHVGVSQVVQGDVVVLEAVVTIVVAVVGFWVQVAPVGHGQTIPDSYSLTQP
jgi:hypothetical protein